MAGDTGPGGGGDEKELETGGRLYDGEMMGLDGVIVMAGVHSGGGEGRGGRW